MSFCDRKKFHSDKKWRQLLTIACRWCEIIGNYCWISVAAQLTVMEKGVSSLYCTNYYWGYFSWFRDNMKEVQKQHQSAQLGGDWQPLTALKAISPHSVQCRLRLHTQSALDRVWTNGALHRVSYWDLLDRDIGYGLMHWTVRTANQLPY